MSFSSFELSLDLHYIAGSFVFILVCTSRQSYDQVWDPKLAEAAQCRGEDIEGFLKRCPVPERIQMQHLIHDANYSVSDAVRMYVRLQASHRLSTKFTRDESALFMKLIVEFSKDFQKIASKMEKSVSDCLEHYYGCYKQTPDYKELKNYLRQDSDSCVVCDDGGDLIVCDGCAHPYHMECLSPPLTEVPMGSWMCPNCEEFPDSDSRIRISRSTAGSRVEFVEYIPAVVVEE